MLDGCANAAQEPRDRRWRCLSAAACLARTSTKLLVLQFTTDFSRPLVKAL